MRPGLSVVFIGTPEFAAATLAGLCDSPHQVQRVLTQPGGRRGRGLRRTASPVALAALELGLAVDEVGRREHSRIAALLADTQPDVLVCVAWGGLLRKAALAAPRLAAINLHPSLLPRWRGAAPIERALLAGDRVTGLTVIHMDSELDSGDIILSAAEPIPDGVDAGYMRSRLARRGGELLVQALDLLAQGAAPRIPQGQAGLTWAPKLTADDEMICWQQAAQTTVNRVRALSPQPGARFVHAGSPVIVTRAAVVEQPNRSGGFAPGQVCGRAGEALLVAAGDGAAVALHKVKPAGGREMSGAAYANGRRLAAGDLLLEGGRM